MKSFIKCSIFFLIISMISSCSEKFDIQKDSEQKNETSIKTCPMTLHGGVIKFNQGDTKSSTKAISTTWTEGDKIYITFYNDTTKIPGEAIYSTSNGWNVSFEGDLKKGTNLKCELRHFVNASFSSSSLVSLNSGTEIYEALNGLYEYNGSSLNIQASMMPKTGRIHFKGTSGEKIHITGISTFTTYSPETNSFSNTKAMITTTVDASGYTPYIYGVLANENKKLGLIASNSAFTKTCSDEVLKVGDSGYMAIPTESSHTNWRSGLYVTVNGEEFKMIPVSGHADGFFMIGETEVTNELYAKVKGATWGDTETKLSPKDNISYLEITDWIDELNSQVGLNFLLPSASQWLYAAKGGIFSQNYTYSGSNNASDVAWYEANTQTKHNVKTKAPNELGLYDMSGNVAEFTSTLYNSYYPEIYGGSYHSKISSVTAVSYFATTYTYFGEWHDVYGGSQYDSYTSTNCKAFGIGFRLILTCN